MIWLSSGVLPAFMGNVVKLLVFVNVLRADYQLTLNGRVHHAQILLGGDPFSFKTLATSASFWFAGLTSDASESIAKPTVSTLAKRHAANSVRIPFLSGKSLVFALKPDGFSLVVAQRHFFGFDPIGFCAAREGAGGSYGHDYRSLLPDVTKPSLVLVFLHLQPGHHATMS